MNQKEQELKEWAKREGLTIDRDGEWCVVFDDDGIQLIDDNGTSRFTFGELYRFAFSIDDQ